MHMARRLRMNELIGELLRHGSHEVAMLAKKGYVFVIGGGLDGIYFNGIRTPVLEKKAQRLPREGAGFEGTHERAVRYPFFPSLLNSRIEIVHISFRFLLGH